MLWSGVYDVPIPLRVVLLLLTSASAVYPAQAAIFTGATGRPAVLELVQPIEGLTALAISRDGQRAAAAAAGAEPDRQTRLTLYAVGEQLPVASELPGQMRDLMFLADGSALLGIQHKPAKRFDGESFLLRIELPTLKARPMMRLPPSARGIAAWPEQGSLLIACLNELRTVLLPDLRTGPLYRIPGNNLSLALLGEGSRILVGQDRALLVVDLDDPPQREGMPVREQIALDSPAVTVVSTGDPAQALVRLEDGRVLQVTLDPLAVHQAGTATVLLRWKPPGLTARLPQRPAAKPEPSPLPVRATPPEEVAGAPPQARPAPAQPVATPPAEPERTVPIPPAPPAAAPPPGRHESAPKLEQAPPRTGGAGAQVRGRIVGMEIGQVRAVVLLGPNSLLLEAARVTPGGDGSWTASGLAPGRYRILLDGGGNSVLVTEPPFLQLQLAAGQLHEAAELRVLGEH